MYMYARLKRGQRASRAARPARSSSRRACTASTRSTYTGWRRASSLLCREQSVSVETVKEMGRGGKSEG